MNTNKSDCISMLWVSYYLHLAQGKEDQEHQNQFFLQLSVQREASSPSKEKKTAGLPAGSVEMDFHIS